MFYFGCDADPNDPVFAHDGEEFINFYVKVHFLLGSRLRAVVVHPDGQVDFTGCLFRVVDPTEPEGPCMLAHIGGSMMPCSAE
eukprot:7333383-Lingulodinium_polyedra.AAC.1